MLSLSEASRSVLGQFSLRDLCFSLDFSPFGRRPKGSASDLKVRYAQDDGGNVISDAKIIHKILLCNTLITSIFAVDVEPSFLLF